MPEEHIRLYDKVKTEEGIIIKVTVIMPSLNVARYIRASISSVLNQTMHDLEVICIDAGSTDGTLEILMQYAEIDHRIKVVHSEKKSYGYQLNEGIAIAQGEYIGIVETDDIAEPDMFQKLYETAAAFQYPEYVKGTAMLMHEVNGSMWETAPVIPCGELNAVRYEECVRTAPCKNPSLFETDGFLWNGIYRSDFLKNIIFQETAGAAFQDISVLYRIISTAKTAVYINRKVYLYRQDNILASSFSKKGLIYVEGEYRRIISEYLPDMSEEWIKICYKKLIMHTIDRFQIMGTSGEMWKESEPAIESIREKIRYASEMGIVTDRDFNDKNKRKIQLFMKDAEELFQSEYMTQKKNAEYFLRMKDRIGESKVVIFGSGIYGQKIACLLQISFDIAIEAFWDNSQMKQGTFQNMIPVEKPKICNGENVKVVVAVKKEYRKDIAGQLLALGYKPDDLIVFDRDDIDYRIFYWRFH